jgi:HD superfamily phosphohydrolase
VSVQVNNGRSGFDVDKLDYFKRDNMMAGLDVSMGWDLDRCFSEAR